MCGLGMAPIATLLYKDIIKFRYGQAIIKNHINYYQFVFDFYPFSFEIS